MHCSNNEIINFKFRKKSIKTQVTHKYSQLLNKNLTGTY